MTDVVHRALFGLQAVNVHEPGGAGRRCSGFSPLMQDAPRATAGPTT